LIINERQAGVVRWIFERYADVESPRAITHALNAPGEPGPRDGTCTPSTIRGDRRTGDGLLHQEISTLACACSIAAVIASTRTSAAAPRY
jgi:hypothetical protein